jgi:hypothetical protein
VGIFSGVRAAAKPWMISFDGDGENEYKDVMIGMYLGAIISICVYRIMYAYESKSN